MMHKKAPAGFPVEALAKPFWSGVAAGWPGGGRDSAQCTVSGRLSLGAVAATPPLVLPGGYSRCDDLVLMSGITALVLPAVNWGVLPTGRQSRVAPFHAWSANR